MEKIYSKIFEFCIQHPNKGCIYNNKLFELTPRVRYIIKLLNEFNLDYELHSKLAKDPFKNSFRIYNILIKGSSNKYICAHHDILNPDSENANDNTSSIINAIACKLKYPDLNLIFTDGEEVGGNGAKFFVDYLHKLNIKPDWILNLELTGIGGRNFVISKDDSDISKKIKSLFNCNKVIMPFNDSTIYRYAGFNSTCITTLTKNNDGKNDYDIIKNCHTMNDNTSRIKIEDMKEFVDEVLCKIIKEI